jgi:hypothetical protein
VSASAPYARSLIRLRLLLHSAAAGRWLAAPVERRHFFVRDMVEEFEIEVPHVSTDDNVADFLTKPIYTSSKFYAFRAAIMNERVPPNVARR